MEEWTMATVAMRRENPDALADRPRGTAGDPAQYAFRPDLGAGAGLRAGQSGDPAASPGAGFLAVLPAQSEAMPADRRRGARRSPRPGSGRGSRYPHRPAALPRLARRRAGRRADRHPQILARRPGHVCDRLFVLVRASVARRWHRTAPHDLDRTVPMYRTSVETVPAGPFHGPLVVSMRPMKPADAIRAVQITTRFPSVHGAPVHLGKPELIGIKDIAKPDWGDAVPIHDDEIPVFWACGVTPQSVIMAVQAGILHHPLSRRHAGDRPPQHRICHYVTRASFRGRAQRKSGIHNAQVSGYDFRTCRYRAAIRNDNEDPHAHRLPATLHAAGAAQGRAGQSSRSISIATAIRIICSIRCSPILTPISA